MATVMGVDSSTQSTKVEVRDSTTGALMAAGRAPHPPTTPPRSEQDPRAWVAAFDTAVAEARQSVRAAGAMSIAAQQHGLVVLDAAGGVLRRAKLWNDTESAPDADRLVEELGAEAWAERCGSVPVASFTITKLAWLRREHPGVFDEVATVLLPHDYLTRHVTGDTVTDRGDASGTGYWSPATNTWDVGLLALVDPTRDWLRSLPVILNPTEPAGEWQGMTVACGTGDNMAAALGLGLQPGDVAISIGTSGTVFAVAGAPTHDGSGAVAGFADASGRYLPLVCTLNATRVTEAFRRLLGADHDRFDTLALAAAPGAEGLVLVPYLDGERTPNRPSATGTLRGIRSDVTPEVVARAAVEGVALGLLDGLDGLAAAGSDVSGRLLLAGGGARSAAYRQVFADLTGRPVMAVTDDEVAARGAGVQAAAVLEGADPLEVGAAWAPSLSTTIVDPTAGVDVVGIREAYAATRDRI